MFALLWNIYSVCSINSLLLSFLFRQNFVVLRLFDEMMYCVRNSCLNVGQL